MNLEENIIFYLRAESGRFNSACKKIEGKGYSFASINSCVSELKRNGKIIEMPYDEMDSNQKHAFDKENEVIYKII